MRSGAGLSGGDADTARRARRISRLRKRVLTPAALLACVGLAACAQRPGPPTESQLAEIVSTQQARIEALERRVAEQSRRLAEPAELDELRGGAAPSARLPQMEADAESSTSLAQLAPGDERLHDRPEPVAPRPWPPAPPPAPPDPAVVREEPTPLAAPPAPPERPEDVLLVERGAILLPSQTLQLEGSLDYTRFSGPRVAISGLTLFEAIIIGRIRVDELNRDIVTAAATARYGITDRLQADVRVPFVYRHDREVRGIGVDESERRTWTADIGDVSGRLSYQALIGDGAFPDVIVRAEGRAPTGRHPFGIRRVEVEEGVFRLARPPTGSGFYEFGGGALFVWRVDPVVFFTGGTYTHRLARNFSEPFGRIVPGDSVQGVAGINIRLTDRFGLNLSFVDQITFSTKRNGRRQAGTRGNDGRFIVGTSLALGRRFSLLASTGIGLTNDAPDFQFTLSLTHTLGLGG